MTANERSVGSAGADARGAAILRGAAQPATAVNFDVPGRTCDCLTHVFGDTSRFPMAPGRTYTPELASLRELRAVHQALHVERAVLVQTTVYGADNSCMVDALKELGPSARGIAVIDDATSPDALNDLDRAGVRGIRLNFETVGITDPAVARRRFQDAVAQLDDRPGWHIQMFARLSVIESLHDLIAASPVPVSLDHFAGTPAAGGMREAGFDLVLDLLRSGSVYVKLSAPELVSTLAPDYPDVVPVARALVEANPERILWASHWPHPDSDRGERKARRPTDVTPLRQIDDGYLFNMLPLWAPDAAARQAILVDNPSRLYGFE